MDPKKHALKTLLDQLPSPLFDCTLLWDCFEVMDIDDAIATVSELIALYLDDAVVHRDRIQTAIAQKDGDQLRRAAHTLKSSSRSLGAAALGDLCEILEEHAIANRLTLASLQRNRLEQLFDQSLTILAKLHREIAQHQSPP